MPQIRQFDHVGITVADLDSVTAFRRPGSRGRGPHVRGGRAIDTVIDIPDSRIESSCYGRPTEEPGRARDFVRPAHEPGSPTAMANELGLRSICFEVDDLQAAVDGLAANGYGFVERIDQHENIWQMAHVHQAEEIVVFAERTDELTHEWFPLPLQVVPCSTAAKRILWVGRAPEYRSDGAGGERPRHAGLQRTRVALHAVRQICGLPAQDGIEPEQHDRRERIEKLWSTDPEPGCEVDQKPRLSRNTRRPSSSKRSRCRRTGVLG